MSVTGTHVTTFAEGFAQLDSVSFYRIPHLDRMAPFLMSLTSDSDLWMYVSSTGGLTAGRCSEEQSLFPYETDDKLHQASGITGPVTAIRVEQGDKDPVLWEPFGRSKPASAIGNLYKTALGNRIVFEEVHGDLGLTFRYQWAASAKYGFVRTCTLELHPDHAPVSITVLDGLLNILPGGVALSVQQMLSCLANAYAQNEVDPETHLGVFAMTSRMVDKAEPAEMMTANLVWTCGLPNASVTLFAPHAGDFRAGQTFDPVTLCTGRRGAYLVTSTLRLKPGERVRWYIVADANRDQAAAVALGRELRNDTGMAARIEQSLDDADAKLRSLVFAADGMQVTADATTSAHHAANVLFNIMRGGVFQDGYHISAADFAAFVRQRNSHVADQCHGVLASLPIRITYSELLIRAQATGNADLERLAYEYLPLTFSRRHGDPSRPWNHFAIRITNADGSPAIAYQGNWRDIFQNWEALCMSYPEFLLPIIAKFVNASTPDGFNPYRVAREGIDWEAPDPNHPWANIGYWGDHQIVYLLRLMEAANRFYPGKLRSLLTRAIFSYADVPYRLKPYQRILANPHDTITFDWEAHRKTLARSSSLGSDGRLVFDPSGQVVKVNLLEKLLVPILAKLSCFVLDGGIWMNTQRPEWNDANNALVGYGISMVTLCHLRRHIAFVLTLLPDGGVCEPRISGNVGTWFGQVRDSLQQHEAMLGSRQTDDLIRKAMLDELGMAFCGYRQRVYAGDLGTPTTLSWRSVRDLLQLAQRYLDHAIVANRREDNLYHSYNLLAISSDGKRAGVQAMYEMLEGQVAVLGSGILSAQDAIDVLEALYASAMFRGDQQSFMLYPARALPRFLEKNRIPTAQATANPLLASLLAAGDRSIVIRDAAGDIRFAPEHANARTIASALDTLATKTSFATLVQRHRQDVLDLYEQVFHHRSFTGRSGTMYGYEGIGCIYWHMVAKLLLAAQECCFQATASHASEEQVQKLRAFYRRIRAGLGFNKTASQYGAFPTDPYSHTPAHAGAQQPGMTGQVKEEILCRWGELGVAVREGCIQFRPTLLDRTEFLTHEATVNLLDDKGQPNPLIVHAGELAFTWCQTPIVYHAANTPKIRVTFTDGTRRDCASDTLDHATSAALIGRTGNIARIDVSVVV